MNVFMTYKYGRMVGLINIIVSWAVSATFCGLVIGVLPDNDVCNNIVAYVAMIGGIAVSIPPLPNFVKHTYKCDIS